MKLAKRIISLTLSLVMATMLLAAPPSFADSYEITFDLNYDGAPEPTTEDTDLVGNLLVTGQLSSPPEREGYTFGGWFLKDEEEGVLIDPQIDETTLFDDDTTVYAGWTVEITFDQNYEGAPGLPEADTDVNGKLDASDIPKPTREGYELAGWYTTVAPDYRNPQIDDKTVFATATTVYAHWVSGYLTIETNDSATGIKLGWSPLSGVELIYENGTPFDTVDIPTYDSGVDGPLFKDLNKNGALDPYEDWRLPAEDRVDDLVERMLEEDDAVEQIAGLMLYSAHYPVDSTVPTDAQKEYLEESHLRHILITNSRSAAMNARWNNNVQALCEELDFGIPSNNSSDPRHTAGSTDAVEYYVANSGVSKWPNSLGLGATFDVETTKAFGKIASREYRALGITTALSPQIDIATDPRWGRFNGTFGEDPLLGSEMAKAYVDGFQTTYAGANGVDGLPVVGGWGMYSVNAMMKHWPGGGAGEGGRDAHFDNGKFAVFPGGNFTANMIPFVDGSLDLDDGTGMATAVMPYYTISYLQVPGSEPNSSDDPGSMLNMANSYSDYMINGVLRDSYKFNGVVCTDWNVIGPNEAPGAPMFDPDIPGMIWGPDDHYGLTGFTLEARAARARLLLDAGVDQFGGLNTIEPIVAAYNNASEDEKDDLLDQLATSAKRLLMNIFRTGLFENAYLDSAESTDIVGNDDFMKAGYDAQLKSMVLLKNVDDLLPLPASSKIYAPGADDNTIKLLKSKFDNASTDPTDMDVALVFMSSPSSGGGSRVPEGTGVNMVPNGGHNTYTPINLDFKPYTATKARTTSIAGTPIREDGTLGYSAGSIIVGMENRSYKGLTQAPANVTAALNNLNAAYDSGLDVIISFNLSRPTVMEDIEGKADAILVDFSCQRGAIVDMLLGETYYGDESNSTSTAVRPTGMLPMQLPLNMDEVEQQYEDVPRDMECYVDSEGNAYDFGFGLTWESGTTKQIDENVNPGYKDLVEGNQDPMTVPANDGDPTSEYYILNRRNVTFDYGYKEDEDNDRANRTLIKVVNAGEKVTDIVDPRDGYTALGWYKDTDLTDPYDFDDPVQEPLTLFGEWEEIPSPTPTPIPPGGTTDGGGGGGGGSSTILATPTPEPTPGEEPGEGETEGGDDGADGAGTAVITGAPLIQLDAGGEGYISGYPDNTVRADANVTRYEVATIFYRLAVDDAKESFAAEAGKFSDVAAGEWYTNAVGYLAAKGIILGYPDGTFKGDNAITRAEFVTIASKFSDLSPGSGIPFSDVAGDYWAYDYIATAYNNGWINGYPDGTFGPERNITRAETMVIVNNMLGWDADSVEDVETQFTDLAGDEWYYNQVLLAVFGSPE